MYVEGKKMNIKIFIEKEVREKLAEAYANALIDNHASFIEHIMHGTISKFSSAENNLSVDRLVEECHRFNVGLDDFKFTDIDAVAFQYAGKDENAHLIIFMTRKRFNEITGEGKA